METVQQDKSTGCIFAELHSTGNSRVSVKEVMSREREQILKKRRKLKNQYGELFDLVAALLFKHDPVDINFQTNTDEYEPEVVTILPRLSGCQSSKEVRHIVYEEFVNWFDEDIAGTEERYEPIAAEIWDLLQKQGR